MKLSAWAKLQGISDKTAWRMWKDGRLPVPAEQLPTGTVIIHQPANAVDLAMEHLSMILGTVYWPGLLIV